MPPEVALSHWGARVVVAAHPDDETIGLGARLAHLPDPYIVHLTDGAPANMMDARAAGFTSHGEYARARRQELLAAMRLAAIPEDRLREVGLPDQQAAFHMAETARQLSAFFDGCRAAVVFTHPYEGGHPDHDATAFAVHAACRMASHPPVLFEFALYHDRNGALETGRFLFDETDTAVSALDADARRHKQAMLDCFATQRKTLAQFPADVEPLRRAPRYDFTLPPHPGTLWYERFDWGMTGERFRALASEALMDLGLAVRSA